MYNLIYCVISRMQISYLIVLVFLFMYIFFNFMFLFLLGYFLILYPCLSVANICLVLELGFSNDESS